MRSLAGSVSKILTSPPQSPPKTWGSVGGNQWEVNAKYRGFSLETFWREERGGGWGFFGVRCGAGLVELK